MQLHGPVKQEQSRLVIRLDLRDVGLAPVPLLGAVLGPVAGPATLVASVVSYYLGPVGGAALSASAGAALGAPSCPGLGTSAPFARLAALAATSRGRGLPLFPAPRRASDYSRVRWSFPPMEIPPEGGCGSSLSTTLRRPIASSIDMVERSSRDSIE